MEATPVTFPLSLFVKVPEKHVTTEAIPRLDTPESGRLGVQQLNHSPEHKDLTENDKCESTSYIPSSISLRRHSGCSSYSTAINLSIDSTRIKVSSPSNWEKPVRSKYV